jgi:chromate transporter
LAGQRTGPSDVRIETARRVSFRDAARFWIRLGFINFGGPTGQIALMHEELVDRRRWISSGRFLHALNFCMLLPGPEAQQLAIYVGWLLHKVRGGLVAGIAFIAPAFFLILGLSWAYAVHGDVPAIAGILSGLQAAVVGIIAAALIRIGRRALHNGVMVAIAMASFVSIFFVGIPFPFVILGAAAVGLFGRSLRPRSFRSPQEEPDSGGAVIRDDASAPPDHTVATAGRAVRVVVVGLAVWMVPLLVVSV